MLDADIGYGTTFERSADGTPAGAMATIGEVLDVTPPSVQKDMLDATHMGSPGGYREWIVGLKDGGEASVDIQFASASVAVPLLIADAESSSPGYYVITLPGGSNWAFYAYITAFDPSVPLADKMTASVKFKVTGQPVFTQV